MNNNTNNNNTWLVFVSFPEEQGPSGGQAPGPGSGSGNDPRLYADDNGDDDLYS